MNSSLRVPARVGWSSTYTPKPRLAPAKKLRPLGVADQHHWARGLRHAALGLERYGEHFWLDTRGHLHHPVVGAAGDGIEDAGVDGLAVRWDDPELVAFCGGRRSDFAFVHEHAHFRVVHHVRGALRLAGLWRERDGDGVVRFHEVDGFAHGDEPPLLCFHDVAEVGNLEVEQAILVPKPGGRDHEYGERGNKDCRAPASEESGRTFS